LELPSSKYSGLISLRIDWFDLLAVQEISRVFSNTTVQKHQFFGCGVGEAYTTERKMFFKLIFIGV